jgi:putative heme-binding domain-containing protein
MHKLTRTVLGPEGATFSPTTEDFVSCAEVDFHPTDVLEDADGSLLILDTGGWYKLCCPTSQLAKPDVLGTIYRLKRKGSHGVKDARGMDIPWPQADSEALVKLLSDPRHSVRQRCMSELARRGPSVVSSLRKSLAGPSQPRTKRNVIWTLSRIDAPTAREAIRLALHDADGSVRQVALHCVSAWRDELARNEARTLLQDPSPHVRRTAAEAVGRIGRADDVDELLAAGEMPADRVLEHSMIYALIEIAEVGPLQKALEKASPAIQRLALIALDQIGDGHLAASAAIARLGSTDESVRAAAEWVVQRHPDWAEPMADFFRGQLQNPSTGQQSARSLVTNLTHFLHNESVQNVIAEFLQQPSNRLSPELRSGLVEAIGQFRFQNVSPSLRSTIGAELDPRSPHVSAAVRAIDQLAKGELTDGETKALQAIAARSDADDDLRLTIIGVIAKRTRRLDDATVRFLCDRMAIETPPGPRGRAVDILTSVRLDNGQRRMLADSLSRVGPLDLKKVVETFDSQTDAPTRAAVFAGLDQSTALASLTPADLRAISERLGNQHDESIKTLIERVERLNAEKIQRFAAILALLDKADARRGQLVFQGAKASCSACHKAGYLGGDIGPDLSRIGDSRSEADLLESILLPSATLVRSFEPETIVTDDGKSYNGLVRAETDDEVTLVLDATKTVHIQKSTIDERVPGTVSIMPSGIDQALTSQELADVVRFLKTAR